MPASRYDIIVLGAGHAGCEAACAAASMGMRVLMLAMNIDTVGHMPCAPAVGGVGKGHLVRELDAMGGVMGWVTDRCALQYKTLNASKGLAVHSTRAQVDRLQYRRVMRRHIEDQPNIDLRQALVTRIHTEGGRFAAVEDSFGFRFEGTALIITAGTFLGGLMHVGSRSFAAGRAGEFPATDLSQSLRDLGFDLGRFKTGTGARLKRSSIDFTRMEPLSGDGRPRPFSWRGFTGEYREQPCYVTHTNERTHRIILDNLDRSALYGGQITATSARYCPSLEDKVVKFRDKERHQVIIEPEGIETDEMYSSGLGNSMTPELQEAILRSCDGLEQAVVLRPAYAIEYDYLLPHQLMPSLESKAVPGIFTAGQINGTSGYEEAAAQGFMAGVNAALSFMGEPPFVLGRDEAYIGVMIDDLVTRGTDEPYRVFTARAEYRLFLREDNVASRLTRHGNRLGLVTDERMQAVEAETSQVGRLCDELRTTKRADPDKGDTVSLEMLLRRGMTTLANEQDICVRYPETVRATAEIEAVYAGYLERQRREVERFRNLEIMRIPEGFDYDQPGISTEVREKLAQIRPVSIGQASRIPGITPAAVSLLMVYVKRADVPG